MTHGNVSFSSGVLHVLVQDQRLPLVDQLLHRIVDKLIERVNLLRDESLVCKVGRDDCPTVVSCEVSIGIPPSLVRSCPRIAVFPGVEKGEYSPILLSNVLLV